MARFRERKLRCNIRKFLNLPGMHENASIVAYVERMPKKSDERPYVRFTLSDCSNTATLEFATWTEDDRVNSLYKANVLVDAVTKFRDALEIELARLAPTADDDDEDW